MKKIIVVFLALILAGPSAMRATPQDDLKGKVVRIGGGVNGMGVVLLYKAGSCIILDEVDGSKRQGFDLKNQEYELVVLAFSREAYLQMQVDGLTPVEIAAWAKLAPAVSPFAYLSAIAENGRKRRIGTAISSLIAGGVVSTYGLGILGVHYLSDFQGLGLLTLAGGLIVSGVGVFNLANKSSAECSYDQAQKMSVEKREAFCADALKKESRKAQSGRIIKSGLFFGLATFFLVARPWPVTGETEFFPTMDHDADYNIHSAIVCGLFGLVNLFLRNYEETAYSRFLKEKIAVEQSNKLTLNIGLVPRGFALGLRYCFQ